MSAGASIGTQFLLVAALTWLLPWLGMRMLAQSLVSSAMAKRVNYRGRTVFVGLGIVWLFWVAGMALLRYFDALADSALAVFNAVGAVSALVIATLLFGVLDDAYGSSDDRGFRGHLTALRGGRLTTGVLKMLGIGLVSLAAASSIVGGLRIRVFPSATHPPAPGMAIGAWLGWTLVLGAVIALSANLTNLLDVRPGRALKWYSVWAIVLGVMAWVSGSTTAIGAAMLGFAMLGPAVAVWRQDVGEHGMLGDSGANAAGAVIGFVAAWECGRSWTTFVVLIVLLAANLASELWSFSEVIASNRVLSYLDGLGRLTADSPTSGEVGEKKSTN